MPPANAFLSKEERTEEKFFPLSVLFCNRCSLLQVPDIVHPSILFKNYVYSTSASKPLADHFTKTGLALAERFISAPSDLVVEIGGNDGVLLSAIQSRCRVLNVEPAENIAEISKQKGIETLNEFFNSSLADTIIVAYGKARLVVANNVMAHIDNIRNVWEGIKNLLSDDGVFVFEVHWVGNLIGDGGFDQIYHEHLCYWSLHALSRLARDTGLIIFDVEMIPNQGESMRVYVGRNVDVAQSVHDLLRREKTLGLHTQSAFMNFAEKVRKNKEMLVQLLDRLKREGKTIVGYGAPAKGNTLLNYMNITAETVAYLIDDTPLKQGLYAPGSHILVYPRSIAATNPPDYFLLLAWNYAGFILQKEKDFAARGGKFIIPVPRPRVI